MIVLELLFGSREKLLQILTRAKFGVLHQISQKSLEAPLALLDNLMAVIILVTAEHLLWDVDHDATRVVHLQNLDQPFEVIVSPVYLLLGLVRQRSPNHVLAEILSRPCGIVNLDIGVSVVVLVTVRGN